MFGNRKRIALIERDIELLGSFLQSELKAKEETSEKMKRLLEEVETLRKELSDTKKALSDLKTLRGMTTVPEAPVSISDVMDEWLNGKEDASENE